MTATAMESLHYDGSLLPCAKQIITSGPEIV